MEKIPLSKALHRRYATKRMNGKKLPTQAKALINI